MFLPLIAAFSLYFICQHSVNAWQDLKNGLNLNSLQLYKQALPYLLGAIIVFVFILMFNPIKDYSRMTVISSFFIFLSCISLPHVILMHVFYKQSNYNSI
jgi:cell division protein FtsW (lipid II flippase)